MQYNTLVTLQLRFENKRCFYIINGKYVKYIEVFDVHVIKRWINGPTNSCINKLFMYEKSFHYLQTQYESNIISRTELLLFNYIQKIYIPPWFWSTINSYFTSSWMLMLIIKLCRIWSSARFLFSSVFFSFQVSTNFKLLNSLMFNRFLSFLPALYPQIIHCRFIKERTMSNLPLFHLISCHFFAYGDGIILIIKDMIVLETDSCRICILILYDLLILVLHTVLSVLIN